MLRDNAMGLVDRLVPAPDEAEIVEAVRAAMRACAENGRHQRAGHGRQRRDDRGARCSASMQRLARDGQMTVRARPALAARRLAGRWPSWGSRRTSATTACASAGSRASWTARSGRSTAKMFEPFVDEREARGVYVTPPDKMRHHDPRGRQGRPVGRRPRHRRRGQRRAARPLRGGGQGRTARATGGSASSTPSTCGRRTTRASRNWASSRRCSRTTRSTTAAGPRGASARGGARRRTPSGRCWTPGRSWRSARTGRWPRSTSLPGIDAAVNRRTLDGKHPDGWFPEQRITVAEAVEAYTLGAPTPGFRRRTAGRSRPGKLADLVVLSRDILAPAERDHIADTKVVLDGRRRKGRVRAEVGPARPLQRSSGYARRSTS